LRPIPVRAYDRMIPGVATPGIIQASTPVKHISDRQSLCLSQGSSAPKSLGAKNYLLLRTESFHGADAP